MNIDVEKEIFEDEKNYFIEDIVIPKELGNRHFEEIEILKKEGKKILPKRISLNNSKMYKKVDITNAKKTERAKGLKVGSHTFFSTPLDLQKYDHAMKTGKRIAKSKDIEWEDFKGKIKVQEGLVEVTGAEFDVALGAIDIFLYKTWYKEQLLHGAVDACSSVEEVESINWE